MSLTLISFVVLVIFALGYFFYSRFLSRLIGLNDQTSTPAVTVNDGIDFVPAKAPFLLGQHFSAIAAAGPIVGPILAGVAFGWLPTLLWIVLGAIFIGAAHDFSSLVGSVRHGAGSVAHLIEYYISRRAYALFLAFIWLSLVYVITAFADLTASSFAEPVFGGGVATSSTLYILLGVVMGICITRFKMPLGWATPLFTLLVGIAIWIGPKIPLQFGPLFGLRPDLLWDVVVLSYCFIASVLPVWILLQPRGYLGGIFLYVALGAGFIGLALGGVKVQYPAFIGWTSASGMPLLPMLFVTVACGACSGFHGLVCSGTTSKQIEKESDCRMVGYGAMILEGVVALIALATVMMLPLGDPALKLSPDRIYAQGLASFVQQFGIPYSLAMSFVLLAFATFIFDTLDVATRLGRYIIQELFGWKGKAGAFFATLLTLAIPAWCVTMTVTDAAGKAIPAWRLFWTVFGTSNQLLAALTLLGLTAWLRKKGKPWIFAAIPCLFMMVMTLWALVTLLQGWIVKLRDGTAALLDPVSLTSILLIGLAFCLLVETARVLRRPSS